MALNAKTTLVVSFFALLTSNIDSTSISAEAT
jgi:hypothetical protein